MSAFINIGFVTSVNSAWMMSIFFEQLKICFRGTTVVTRENNECVIVEPGFFDRCHQFAHMVIRLHHEIGIGVQSTRVLEWRNRDNGCVGRRQGKVDEEGFARFRIGCAFIDA